MIERYFEWILFLSPRKWVFRKDGLGSIEASLVVVRAEWPTNLKIRLLRSGRRCYIDLYSENNTPLWTGLFYDTASMILASQDMIRLISQYQ